MVDKLKTGDVVGSAAIFCLQVFTMESLSPEDAYGSHFSLFVVAECGGAMLAGFCTLIRERAKARFNCRIIGNTEVTPNLCISDKPLIIR